MTTLVVHPAEAPLTGSVPVPADEGIAQTALVLAALARGESRVTGAGAGAGTASCLRTLGVAIDERGPGDVRILGVGVDGLKTPAAALEFGRDARGLLRLCGLLAAQEFRSTLRGDVASTGRLLARVVAVLRGRGASIEGAPDPGHPRGILPPIEVGLAAPGARLAALEYDSPTACAPVKTALLLSGLYAEGPTLLKEPCVSRDDTERLLRALGAPLRTVGSVVEVNPAGWNRELPAFELAVPGDLSAAAFPLAAAQIVEGSRIAARAVGVSPTRSGLLEIARDMGAGLAVEPQGERSLEPVATLHAWHAPLRAVSVGGEVLVRASVEVPVACALAARAHGTTRVADADELREDGTDRLAAMAGVLRAFGVDCARDASGLAIAGRQGPLEAAEVDSRGDARIAMTAAVLALVGRGPSRVRDAGAIADVYPKFVATLRALGARIDVLAS